MRHWRSMIGIVGLAFAISSQAGGWAKEPATVFGATFGAPIDYRELRACGDAPSSPKYSFCAMDRGEGATRFPVGGFPIYEFRGGVADLDEDGNLVRLFISGKHDDYSALRAILTERYGPPTNLAKVTLGNKMGAVVASEELTWRGRRMDLTLSERSSTLESTSIVFSYRPYFAKRSREEAARTKSNASKL